MTWVQELYSQFLCDFNRFSNIMFSFQSPLTRICWILIAGRTGTCLKAAFALGTSVCHCDLNNCAPDNKKISAFVLFCLFVLSLVSVYFF